MKPLPADVPPQSMPMGARPAEVALLASVFVVAACGLVYELAAGALASYLLGDSVLQFSTVIGTYLFAMGVGSWLSRHVERELVAQFLRIELAVGLVGGLMPAALFIAHSVLPASGGASFRALLYLLVLLVGVLVGLEIPLVMRILKRHFRERYALKDLVVAGADLRLPRRAGRGGGVSAAAVAATGPGAHRRVVRAAQCSGRGVGAVAVSRRAGALAQPRDWPAPRSPRRSPLRWWAPTRSPAGPKTASTAIT